MFRHCLTCRAPFPENDTLEHFQYGRRVAYDPARGRLWAICRNCRRWTLAPIEDRWEALEELERIVTDRARVLARTDNVSLLTAGRLEVVRVGDARLAEQAWWRYGRELTRRREKFRRISFAGTVAVGAAVAGGWVTGGLGWLGAWLLWENAPRQVTGAARWLRFGGVAWRGERACPSCGHVFRTLRFQDRRSLVLAPAGEGSLSVFRPCPVCAGRGSGLFLDGTEADRTIRRVLAYHHYAGASEQRVKSATRLIQEAGTPADLTRILLKAGRHLGELRRTGAIALEIAANEDVERRLLELEVAALEARWREEEELAAIVDGELTPVPVLESLRRKVSRLV